MTAYNIVRFKVKPGQEKAFLDAHRGVSLMPDMLEANLVKTGDHAYCFVGKWDKQDSIVAARPQMIKLLDSFRNTLEDMGGGLGVTDPASGSVVVEFK